MRKLKFKAIAMAMIEDAKTGEKEWIIHARDGGELVKIHIEVGEFQMQTLERALETSLEAPCA